MFYIARVGKKRAAPRRQFDASGGLRGRREYRPKPLDNKRFGRGRVLMPIFDLRRPNQGIESKFSITSLFVGTTAVLAPHCDDASLNYGGGIIRLSSSGRKAHIINVSPGYRAPFPKVKGNSPEEIKAKTATRVREGEKEAGILGAGFHYLDLRLLYDERRIVAGEAKQFYRMLDSINPVTLVIPGPFDTHPDHRHVRQLSLNWAASEAAGENPKVIVEAPSMWGSIPETMLTHMLEMDSKTVRRRMRAQAASVSQWKRTNFPRVSEFKARAHGIIGGELKHGLVGNTPDLGRVEFYSQHVIIRDGQRLVFRRLDKQDRAWLA